MHPRFLQSRLFLLFLQHVSQKIICYIILMNQSAFSQRVVDLQSVVSQIAAELEVQRNSLASIKKDVDDLRSRGSIPMQVIHEQLQANTESMEALRIKVEELHVALKTLPQETLLSLACIYQGGKGLFITITSFAAIVGAFSIVYSHIEVILSWFGFQQK